MFQTLNYSHNQPGVFVIVTEFSFLPSFSFFSDSYVLITLEGQFRHLASENLLSSSFSRSSSSPSSLKFHMCPFVNLLFPVLYAAARFCVYRLIDTYVFSPFRRCGIFTTLLFFFLLSKNKCFNFFLFVENLRGNEH